MDFDHVDFDLDNSNTSIKYDPSYSDVTLALYLKCFTASAGFLPEMLSV